MSAAYPLFITRPLADFVRTKDALAGLPIEPVAAPLFEITAIPNTPVPSVEDADAVIFTSANGVRYFAAAGGPKSLPAFAVGEASAETARSLGFTIEGVGGGDVDTLLPVLLQSGHRHFLHPAGRHVAGDLKGQLEAHGRGVTRLPLYEAVAATSLPEPLRAAMTAGAACGIGLFSPRTAKIFQDLTNAAFPGETLRHVDLYCLSARVKETVNQAAFGLKTVASAPDMGGFVDMVKLQRT